MQLIILNIFILPLFHHLYHLTDDHVAHGFELFLLGQRHTCGFRFRVKAEYLIAHILPERICLCYALVTRKFIPSSCQIPSNASAKSL